DRSKMRTFERSARVTFYSDGSYGSRELGSTTAEERQTMSAPHYIVAGRGATLAVHGTVKGAVVVYSPERIVIEGNLVYAHEPRYATRYEFDERFERVRPPGFPVTNRYEVDTWDPEWREAEDDRPAEAAEEVRLSSQ